MKTNSTTKCLMTLGLGLALASAAQGGFNPIPLNPISFNQDVVMERTGPAPVIAGGATTASMDNGIANTGDTWNEQGYFLSDTTVGLPPAGTTITTNNHQFTFAPSYTAFNAIMMDKDYFTNANWKLSSPAAYGSLSFLTSGGNGGAQFRYTVHYQNGTSEVGVTNSADWFFVNNNIAWIANGRVNAQTYTLDNYGSQNPRLYAIDVALSGSSSPITNIFLERIGGNDGGHTCIMAISGASSFGGAYTPLLGTGYTADIVVEATAPRLWNLSPPATLGTTATMDGGLANSGNTWFERGYYAPSNTFGVPAAGSTFAAEGDPAHQFTMPADYAQNNAVFLEPTYTPALITLATPAAFSAMSLLTASGNGPASIEITVNYADFSTEVLTNSSPDWFGSSPRAVTTRGRFNVSSGMFETINQDNPRLYYSDFVLANTTTPVVSLQLNYLSTGGRAVVFALSGTAGAVPPLLTSQPASITTWAGSNVTFAVTTQGTEPIAFAWEKGTNGVFVGVPGGNAATLALANVQMSDAADYRVLAANTAGRATSAVASLTILSALPSITVPSDPITAYQPGGGSSPGGEPVANAINRTTTKYLNFATWETPMRVPVGFVVTPSLGRSVIGALRFYTANDAPERDPANYILEGSNDGVSYTLISSNSLVLPDGRNQDGLALDPLAQNVTQVLLNNTVGYVTYRLSITRLKGNSSMMQIGEVEMLGVADASGTPAISQHPTNVKTYVGSNATFNVTATGVPTPGYQWRKGGAIIPGATTTAYTIPTASFGDAGIYSVVVANTAGSITSAPASLTVFSTLADVTNPGDTVASFGDTAEGFWGDATNVNNTIDNVASIWRNGGSGFSAPAGFPPFVGPVGLNLNPTAGTGLPTNTVVSGLRIYTSDGPLAEDPSDFKLEGSNDGGASYTTIASGSLSLPAERNGTAAAVVDPIALGVQEVLFANQAAYTSYRLTFTNTRDNQTARCLALSDVELLGVTSAQTPVMTISTGTGGNLVITCTVAGTLWSTTALTSATTVWTNEGPISGPVVITPQPGVNKFYRVVVP